MDSLSDSARKRERCFQFRAFELSLAAEELRKNGVLIRIPPQLFQVLVMLLMRAGELVTREEIQRQLWGDNVSVEFDAGLNRCIRQLRGVLADEADSPRYIETVPRRGYRFIAVVREIEKITRSSQDAKTESSLCPAHGFVPSAISSPPPSKPLKQRTLRSWVSLVAAVTVVMAILALIKWPPNNAASKIQLDLDTIPLANALGDQYSPSFSPDGRDVTFTWNGNSQGAFHIYRKLIHSPNLLRLTRGDETDYSPVWSPDGNWIAFCRGESKPGGAVWLIPALGGPERKLVDLNTIAWPVDRVLSWSADSKWLVVSEKVAKTAHRGLSLLNVQSGAASQLTSPPPGQDDLSPSVSPDGQTVAFTRDTGHGVGSIYMIPFTPYAAPRKQIRRMMWRGFENVLSANATWTPDGKQIVFESNKRGRLHLFAALANGAGDPTDLTALGDGVSAPTISLEGQLAYAHEGDNVNIWKLNLHSATAVGQRVIASTRVSNTPAVSPNGASLAFASNQYGLSEIWTSKLDGSDLMQMTSLKNPGTGSPAWSPDGSRIVFDSRVDGKPHLYVVSSNGGTPRRIATPGNGFVPVWSPDGQWIYYASDDSGRSEIWRVPPSGGSAEQITFDGGFAPEISPDGRYLYYTTTRVPPLSLWQLTLATKLKKLVAPSVIRRAYAAAADEVYFIAGPVFGPQELYFLGNHASQPVPVVKLQSRIEDSISLSPDGRTLFFGQVEHRSYDLMIAEHFWRK